MPQNYLSRIAFSSAQDHRLAILTMQRRQEVAEMDWSEIDLVAKTWTLSAERAKNGEAHIVPFANLAIDQLKAMQPKPSGRVFTTTGKTAVSSFSKAKHTLDTEMIAIMKELRQTGTGGVAVVSIAEWRLHDIRRTGATNLQALGIPIEVTEAVLNYISGTRAGVAGMYNRYKYEPERRAALDAGDQRLQERDG